MVLQAILSAARTTETDSARYWWVWVSVILIILGTAAQFYVDKIKKT